MNLRTTVPWLIAMMATAINSQSAYAETVEVGVGFQDSFVEQDLVNELLDGVRVLARVPVKRITLEAVVFFSPDATRFDETGLLRTVNILRGVGVRPEPFLTGYNTFDQATVTLLADWAVLAAGSQSGWHAGCHLYGGLEARAYQQNIIAYDSTDRTVSIASSEQKFAAGPVLGIGFSTGSGPISMRASWLERTMTNAPHAKGWGADTQMLRHDATAAVDVLWQF